MFSPCLFYNPTSELAVFVHGGDFVVKGSRRAQQNRMFSASLASPELTLTVRWFGKFMSLYEQKRSRRFLVSVRS